MYEKCAERLVSTFLDGVLSAGGSIGGSTSVCDPRPSISSSFVSVKCKTKMPNVLIWKDATLVLNLYSSVSLLTS